MKLAIIPVKNEDWKKPSILAKKLNKMDIKVLIVDDHSEPPFIKSTIKDMVVIKNRFESGKGSALKYGIIYADLKFRMKADDLIIIMDGDGQINPKEITTFLKYMELNDADVVIGNKRHFFSNTQYGIVRRIVSKTYNALVRFLFGFSYRDTQCGIKIFKRCALDDIISKVNVKRYAFDLELIVALRANNYRVADAPVTIKAQSNHGSVSVLTIFQTFIDTMKIYGNMKKGNYL